MMYDIDFFSVDENVTTACLSTTRCGLLVRERSALADPYCQSTWNSVGSRALSFSGPLLSLSVEFCGFVCGFVRNFEVKYLGNQRS